MEVVEERSSKNYAVRSLGSGGGKIVFTLLTEVIVFYVSLTTIHIRGPSHKGLLPRFVGGRSSSFQNRLEDPLRVLFRILGNGWLGGTVWGPGASNWASCGVGWDFPDLIMVWTSRWWAWRVFKDAFPTGAATASNWDHLESWRSGDDF